MKNEEKAKLIADQCKPCSSDFYSGIYQGVLLALNAEDLARKEAKILPELKSTHVSYFIDVDPDTGFVSQMKPVGYFENEEYAFEFSKLLNTIDDSENRNYKTAEIY